MLSMAAPMLQQQNGVAVTKDIRLMKPKNFTTWPFMEKVYSSHLWLHS